MSNPYMTLLMGPGWYETVASGTKTETWSGPPSLPLLGHRSACHRQKAGGLGFWRSGVARR
jgi:hypothetical protein